MNPKELEYIDSIIIYNKNTGIYSIINHYIYYDFKSSFEMREAFLDNGSEYLWPDYIQNYRYTRENVENLIKIKYFLGKDNVI